MASATARPTFSFHLHSSQTQQSPLTKPRTLQPFHLKKILISPLIRTTTTTSLQFTLNSIDVSKQDKPISEEPDSTTTSPSPYEPTPPLTAEEEQDIEEKFDKRRLEERFAVLNTGIHECRSCGYRYNESVGDSSYPIPAGLPFAQLPEDWRCPTCGAAQSFFESKSVEIAGFAENQQYGLGTNTLTSGQKLILIYGGLGLFFVLFLSGYFLQ
ncbi:Rubredoxin [Thalictrum thalictroides]|uniref:Rubredoxin n=1 Tax=Thalictrum thalictroides TaxID=46969 RepID=A0A7J6WH33_THATH|nr:Rubredoxin [Thalictrum thalictroides]